MPALTPAEHDEVVSVMQSYVASLDMLLKMHPESRPAQEKRRKALVILTKLTEPDPLVKAIETATGCADSLSARLKLRL